MTSKEWNAGIGFLKESEEGQWIEHEGRKITVVNMVAGKFMMTDGDGEFCGATNEEWRAMQFLRNGWFK